MQKFVRQVLSCVLLTIPLAFAQTYPDRPVRIVVPFSPGGGTDIIARMMAQKLTEMWGQSVVVENKTGGNGNIGAQFVAQSKPDGYTLLVTTSALTINLALLENTGYRLKDFTPLMELASSPYLLAVNPSQHNVQNVKELIALAQAQKGALSWASTSEGNAEHLVGELLQSKASFKMNHIPYKGGSDALKDLLGGHVGVGVVSLPTALAHLNSSQLRVLGVTSARRAPQIPNIPTISESGVPGFELPTWYGIWAVAGTRSDIVEKIHASLTTILKNEEVRNRIMAIGFEPMGGSMDSFNEYVQRESIKYAALTASIGLKKK
jgi:tripartite-type tricarboxylate transporter receptor subunit TctC